MPVNRYRRRSSVKLTPRTASPVKPGNYGISPRNISFAPNVTPVTYTAPTDDDDGLFLGDMDSTSVAPIDENALFPPSDTPAPPPTRKRCPPGKRRSQGYIPRPPNAFMLFRADFVRQKHVPGSIETNHGSLSKIIGNCWRALPLEEKRIWEVKAKQEKAAHKVQFPNYRFRPVHNKNKENGNKKKDKVQTTEEDERRCEEVAQLLLEGKKGEELAMAVRDLDNRGRQMMHSHSHSHSFAPPPLPTLAMPQPSSVLPSSSSMAMMYPRRPSSVPLPTGDFFLPPLLPFASLSRPESPVGSISRHATQHFHQPQPQHLQPQLGGGGLPAPMSFPRGHRRSSSAQPFLRRSWTLPSHWDVDPSPTFDMAYSNPIPTLSMSLNMERDPSPLPDVDVSLFNDGFSFGSSASSSQAPSLVRSHFHSHSHSLDVSSAPSPASISSAHTPAPPSLHIDIPVDPLSSSSTTTTTNANATTVSWTPGPTDIPPAFPSATSTNSAASSDGGASDDDNACMPPPTPLGAYTLSSTGMTKTYDPTTTTTGATTFNTYDLAGYDTVGPTDYAPVPPTAFGAPGMSMGVGAMGHYAAHGQQFDLGAAMGHGHGQGMMDMSLGPLMSTMGSYQQIQHQHQHHVQHGQDAGQQQQQGMDMAALYTTGYEGGADY